MHAVRGQRGWYPCGQFFGCWQSRGHVQHDSRVCEVSPPCVSPLTGFSLAYAIFCRCTATFCADLLHDVSSTCVKYVGCSSCSLVLSVGAVYCGVSRLLHIVSLSPVFFSLLFPPGLSFFFFLALPRCGSHLTAVSTTTSTRRTTTRTRPQPKLQLKLRHRRSRPRRTRQPPLGPSSRRRRKRNTRLTSPPSRPHKSKFSTQRRVQCAGQFFFAHHPLPFI